MPEHMRKVLQDRIKKKKSLDPVFVVTLLGVLAKHCMQNQKASML